MIKHQMFYVYKLVDSRDDSIFYIGKGTGDRLNLHTAQVRKGYLPHGNIKLYNRIAEILDSGNEVLATKIFISKDAFLCLTIEARLIYEYGFGQLCNMVNSAEAPRDKKHGVKRESFLEYTFSDSDRDRRSFLFDYNREYDELRRDVRSYKRSLLPKKDSRKVTLRKKTNKYLEEINKYKKKWEEEVSSINMNRSIFDGVVF